MKNKIIFPLITSVLILGFLFLYYKNGGTTKQYIIMKHFKSYDTLQVIHKKYDTKECQYYYIINNKNIRIHMLSPNLKIISNYVEKKFATQNSRYASSFL